MQKKYSRRNFGAGLLAGLGAVSMVAPSTVEAAFKKDGVTHLRMLMGWPKNFPGMGTSANRFAERVADLSDGELVINIFGAGEIVATFEVLDAVALGAADMTHDSPYYWYGKDPAFAYFAVVPFGMTADEHFTWLKQHGGQELWDELGAQHGVKPLACLNTGAQMGGWFKEEIRSAEDLEGKKIRFPGLGGQLLAKLGAVTTNIPGGELFTSLQSGAIDGLEWVAPWNDMAFGFHRVAKHYYYPGFNEMGHCMSTHINLNVWNKLSKRHKAILETAADAEYITGLAEYNARNLNALDVLTTEHDVQLHRWPDDIMQKMLEYNPEILAKNAAKSPMAKKVSDSWMASLEKQHKWAEISDYPNAELKKKTRML